MLPKAHLTSHSRVSGSRWVITSSWLSGSWRSFLYSSSEYSCLENPRDRGAWWAAVYGVAQSWTRLKWLSSCRNLKEFTAFLWEDVRVWAYWNRSFDMYLNCLGPISCVFISWVSSGLTIGSDYSLMTGRWQAFFSFLCTPRIHSQGSGCNHRWLWHPFTDMAVNILFIKANCLPYLLSPKPLPWHSLLSLIENGI